MKKSLVMFLVATLLLAGCTELMSDDGEVTVEMNDELALEKITEIVDPSDDSTWGMTYIMDMDMDSMMGDMGGMDSEEDSDQTETSYSIAMTQAMSPDGVHLSQIIKMRSDDTQGEEIEIVQSWTQIGNTIYLETGYTMPVDSDMSAEEMMMYESMMGTNEFNMKSELTHTKVTEIMSGGDDSDSPLQILAMMMYIESYGTLTPMPSEDGFTMYKAVLDLEAMENGAPTAEIILTMCDSNNDESLSWEEFNSEDCSPDDDSMESQEVQDKLRSYFDQADSNSDGLLDEGELPQFIDNVDNLYSEMDNEEDDHDHGDHDDHSGDDHSDHDDDMHQEEMEFEFAFNSKGDVEFFRMDAGDGSLMTVYMLSDSKVESLTSAPSDGEAVALPFVLSDEPMQEPFTCDNGEEIPADYVNDGMDDCDDGSDEMNHHDHSDEPMFQYECIRFVDSFAIDENSSFNMTYDDTNIDSTMCGEIVSEDMQTHDWDNGEFTMPENFTYVRCDDDGENCEAGDVSAVTTECLLCDPETELYDTFVSSYSECTEDGSDYDNDTGMCTHYIGTLWNSDSMAFEFVNQPDSTLVYYQYDAGTNSGLLLVVAGDEDEHDDGNNGHGNDDDGHDESNPGNSHDDHDHSESDHSDDATMYISIGEAMIPFEGDMNDYSIILANCEDSYDEDTGSETKICDNVKTVPMTDAMTAGSSIMFHDADSSGTISDGDMIHISETIDVDYEEVRLYSSSADAYSDENPVFEMPGFTGVVGVLALLGAALLRRKA